MQYKVEKCKVKEAEKIMNDYASKGWSVLSVTYVYAIRYELVITFEKK